MTDTGTPATEFVAPPLPSDEGAYVAALLQGQLDALNDLALTLKHVHWNVVGPHFIAVHEMIDPQVKAVRRMVDDIAERIATLSVPPTAPRAASSGGARGATTPSAGPTP